MKGYPLTIVTPGNDVPEILKIVKSLSQQYQQTLICGYPPFVKSVIDAGAQQQVPWSSFNMRMILAGEVFSEEWRAMVAAKAGIKHPLTSIVSIYGTADAGVLACESPLSANIRLWLSNNPVVARKLFGKDRLPSLLQYDPKNRFMELYEDDKTLAFTTLPMQIDNDRDSEIRYRIGDAGGLISFAEMVQFIETESNGEFSPFNNLSQTRGARKLPFVYVFGRAFWTVSLYGANVYVDQVMVGLESDPVNAFVTGKFVLSVGTDEQDDSRLNIVIELAPAVSPSDELRAMISQSISGTLQRLNSEYSHYLPKEKQSPLIDLKLFGDVVYFPKGVKHKYII
ncbi:hypothetical protein HDU67_009881 [Dinochytrium kinnereticum]|nr:hypothetical protein HDU67_009881 [Dinochytrium kinnereticum]